MPNVNQRKIIKISVSPAAKVVIKRVADELDMKEIGVASRIYEWFGQQSDVVQKGVLGLYPDGLEVNVARLAMEHIATGIKK
jgi:hypothetical protein